MRILNVSFALTLAAVGCSKSADEPKPAASQGDEQPPATAKAAQLTDAQITHILATVDSAEIEQAQLALQKSNDARVREFATHMVEQHTAAKEKGAKLAAQNGLQPSESAKAKELQANGSATLQQLKAANGKDFDVLYFHAQVDQHATVLRLIEEHLQPAAKDAALRDHLTEARAMVSQHLDHAKQLQQ